MMQQYSKQKLLNKIQSIIVLSMKLSSTSARFIPANIVLEKLGSSIIIMYLSSIRNTYLFSKIFSSAQKAIEGIKDGSSILIGGFGFCGVPMNLVNAVRLSGAKDLKIVSNTCGIDGKKTQNEWGLNMLLRTRQIKRLIFSHLGENLESQRQYFDGEIQLQVCPQGTLAQKIRAGGAGIPAFYTHSGIGTILQTGGYVIKYKKGQKGIEPDIVSSPKQTKVFKGKKYLLEESIFGQYALIKAKRADTMGNLEFHKTARNFNADMATAAKVVIAEVEQIVQPGCLDPESVHVPAIFVDRIYQMDPKSEYSESVIERLTVQDHVEVKKKVRFRSVVKNRLTYDDSISYSDIKQSIRYKIASRAAKQMENGVSINLGVGIPTCLPQVLPHDVHVYIQSENGVIGVGHHPTTEQVDPDIINAGNETITLQPGGSYFSSSQSFAMIRGGHLDVTMIGSFQVSQNCDIANWIMAPGKTMKGMGGAMDLVTSGSRVIVLMQHSAMVNEEREMKLLPQCTLPLTAKGVVDMVITELAVFVNRNGKLVMTQLAQGKSLQEVQSQTGFKIICAQNVKSF